MHNNKNNYDFDSLFFSYLLIVAMKIWKKKILHIFLFYKILLKNIEIKNEMGFDKTHEQNK